MMELTGLPYVIAPMQLSDIATVAQLEQQIFAMPWPASSFRFEVAENKASEYLVLRFNPQPDQTKEHRAAHRIVHALHPAPVIDPSIAGYAGSWMILDEAHICTLAIRDGWRGRGLGELLLLSLIEVAIQHKMDIVTLEVRKSNVVAQRLYEKYGFSQAGLRRRYYTDNLEDAKIMTTPTIQSAAYQARVQALSSLLRHRLERQAYDLPSAP